MTNLEIPVSAHEKIRELQMIYTLNTIYNRSLPSIQDGMKPSQRYLTLSFKDLNLWAKNKHTKSIRPVAMCMANYHPHGDASLYKTMANMTTEEKNIVTPFDGQGYFGGISFEPAKPRYTEIRLSAAGELLLQDLDYVPNQENYDSSRKEPLFLATMWPFLAINGAKGVAKGFSCMHPSYNSGEIMDMCIYLATHKNPPTLQKAKNIVKGPDFPNGCTIQLDDTIYKNLLYNGDTSFTITGQYTITHKGRGRHEIRITELPGNMGTEKFIETVKDKVAKNKINGIASILDCSDRDNPLLIIITTKAGIDPKQTIKELKTNSLLQIDYYVNGVVIDSDMKIRKVGLYEILNQFLKVRIEIIKKRNQHLLEQTDKKIHLLEGIKKILLDIKNVINIIEKSKDKTSAKENLKKTYKLTDEQAEQILEIKLAKLTKLDRATLTLEIKQLKTDKKEYQKISKDENYLKQKILVPELKQTRKIIDRPRKTRISTK